MNQSKAVLSKVVDPFRPLVSRELMVIDCGHSILDALFDLGYVEHIDGGIKRVGYFFVTVNGKAILQKDWNTIINEDDCIAVMTLPLGGGDGGSNIGTILMTVVMVAAAVLTGGATLGVALAWGAAAGVAVGLLGGQVPAPEPATSSLGRESASPTYSISSQGNSARLLEAIPCQYGRMRVYPDLAAQPYTENRGNEAYLYQLFCITQGSINIEAIQIEDSNISSFGDVQYEIIPPGGAVTLFPDNVITSDAVQGLEMLGPNQPGHTVLGPFITSPAGVKVTFLSIDLQMPQGAYRIDDLGKMQKSSASFDFEAREVNDFGAPVGNWFRIQQGTLTFATQTPQAVTYKVAVPEARYEVRGLRSNSTAADTREGNKLIWTGLKAFANSDREYGNVTLLATIIKATNNLNSSTARRINVIGTRKLPTWNPVEGWSLPVATSNPAWAFADALRNADYGTGWSTTRLNLVELYRLSQVWDSRGDEFNAVFDKTITLWSALTQIVGVGRANPVYYAGVVDVVRDEPKTIPAQVFAPANILENTFKTSYKLGTSKTPDYVIVEYFDELIWQATEVECILPGSPTLNPVRITLFGCTNRDQAWREGMYRAAVNRDQRNRTTFTVENEGLLLRFGDMIKVSHDVPAWGSSGRAESLDRDTGRIITSEPMVFQGSGQHFIALRKKNGKADGPYTIVADPSPEEGVNSAIIQATELQLEAIYVSDGIRTDLTQYVFGLANREAANLVVMSAKPNSRGEVAITTCPYVTSTHIADQGGAVPVPPPISELPGTLVGPIVPSVSLVNTTVMGEQRIVAVSAVGAIYYEYQAQPGDGGNWIALGVSADPFMVVHFDAGAWVIRVRAIGAIAGPWATWIGEIEATTLPLATLATFTLAPAAFLINLDWSFSPETNTIAAKVEIWSGATNVLGNAALLVQLPYPANSYSHTGLQAGQRVYYWARVIDSSGRIGPWFNGAVAITAITETDASTLLEALTDKIENTQLSASLREEIASGGESAVIIEELVDDLNAMYTVKTQVTVGGKNYLAGIGVGVENNGDTSVESQILLAASRVAIIDPNDDDVDQIAPFVVEDGKVYINVALIGDAFITNAMIGNVIQSNNYVENTTGWKLDKAGNFEINGSVPGVGRTLITNTGMTVFYPNGVKAVELGILS